jgi:hypothetical protein
MKMENLYIPATKYTPEINLDADKGLIEIKGKSYPENTFEFYAPVIKWIEEYLKCCVKDKVTVNMEIIYFNSSSSKLFFDLFDLLDEVKDRYDITINWIYDEENESAEEAGEDFIEDFENLKINLVKK